MVLGVVVVVVVVVPAVVVMMVVLVVVVMMVVMVVVVVAAIPGHVDSELGHILSSRIPSTSARGDPFQQVAFLIRSVKLEDIGDIGDISHWTSHLQERLL